MPTYFDSNVDSVAAQVRPPHFVSERNRLHISSVIVLIEPYAINDIRLACFSKPQGSPGERIGMLASRRSLRR